MIVSFSDRRTEAFAKGERVAAFSGFERAAERALDRLEAAASLRDLMTPGLRLEKLRGGLAGRFSIRINDQWRVCFSWPDRSPGPQAVEIVDYHRG
jgi:proteic killer suppression protein